MPILKVANVYHDASGFTRTQTASPNTISFVTSNQVRVTYSNTGNVGIGISSPKYKLDVIGAVNAASILLNGNSVIDIANSYAVIVGQAANTRSDSKVSSVSGTSGRITSSGGITPAIDLSTAGAGAASYSTGISAITVDAYGRVTSVTGSAGYITSSGSITGSAGTFTSTTQDSQFNSIGIGISAPAVTGQLRATNNITAFATSDIKFKENIRDIDSASDIVSVIGGKYFDWSDDYIKNNGGEDGYFIRKSDFGVIAQDVQKVFPVAVREKQDGTLAVDYEKLVALAFAAIKELKDEINKMKGE